MVRLLTASDGLVAGYVAGARGRTLRPVLIPGNTVLAELRSRSDSQLPFARVELAVSRGPWLGEPLASAAIDWTCALTAAVLPEGHPYPALHSALSAVLEAVCHAPFARGWTVALARYEALMLREMGYGEDGPEARTPADWVPLMALLDRQGQRLGAHLLADRRRDVMGARAILIDRLRRIAGDLPGT